jgi:hypothetical protein
MKKKPLILILGITVLLTACAGQSTPSPNPTAFVETQPVEQPVITQSEEEPVETISADITYPAPATIEQPTIQVPVVTLTNPYPGPSDDVNYIIDWTKVEEFLLSGQVAKIYHNATMRITLELKDGSLALALEPSLNEFLAVIERCGDPCKDIETIEE